MAAYHNHRAGAVRAQPRRRQAARARARARQLELGGHRYDAEPAEIPARLDVSRTASGYALRLSFDAHLDGPCMRCLGDARAAVEVDAARSTSRGPTTRSCAAPTSTEGELDLAAWAHDALRPGAAPAAALPARLRRALPGLRRIAQRRRSRAPTITRASRIRAGRSCASCRRMLLSARRSYHSASRWPSRRSEPPRSAATSAARPTRAAKPRLNECPRCHSPRLPHRVCPVCGTYAGREVIVHEIGEADSAS